MYESLSIYDIQTLFKLNFSLANFLGKVIFLSFKVVSSCLIKIIVGFSIDFY